VNNPSQEYENLLRELYAAFNARDIDSVLARVAVDVDWPNAWEGGRVRGHEGVRDYWTRQWSAIDPVVEPLSFSSRPDGSVAAVVDQVVRGLDGVLLNRSEVVHVYRFHDGLVSVMEVEELSGGDRASAGRAAPPDPG